MINNKQKFLNILLEDEEFFQEIHQFMVETDWKWADFPYSSSSVPDILKLKDCVQELLFSKHLISETCDSSTGGFRVIYNHYSLIVSFGHVDDDCAIYSREISIKTLRERKLKRIIK